MPEGHLYHRLARNLSKFSGGELAGWSPQGRFAEGAAQINGTRLEVVEAHGKHLLVRLGPDPLREDADPNRAWANLQATPSALGAALLDQSVIAGIGNVFRAEALFACGLHPSRPAASLTRAEFDRLWATVREMMGRAVDDWRIVTVDPPAGRSRTEIPENQARYVYKQACCRRCGAPVVSWSLGGRTAYACPVDQPAASA